MAQQYTFEDLEVGDFVIHNGITTPYWVNGMKYKVLDKRVPHNEEVMLEDCHGDICWFLFEEFDIEKSKPMKKFKNMKFHTPTKEIREFVVENLKQQGYKEFEEIPKYCGAVYAEGDGSITWSTPEYYLTNKYPEVKIITETKYSFALDEEDLVEVAGKKYKRSELIEALENFLILLEK